MVLQATRAKPEVIFADLFGGGAGGGVGEFYVVPGEVTNRVKGIKIKRLQEL